MSPTYDFLIIGGGIFGAAATVALAQRGCTTALFDPGPLPHPLAATTDISKVIRMEYGTNEQYMAMVEASLPVWRQWNELFGQTLYHETGVTFLSHDEMQPGTFEYESYHMLLKRGHHPERLNAAEIGRRFPAWNTAVHTDGFYHAQGGYAESGKVLTALIQLAQSLGTALYEGESVERLHIENGRVTGIYTQTGHYYTGHHTILAAGAWTPLLLPELRPFMRATGHPVFHLKTDQPHLFTPPTFVTFGADTAKTGWYGFPLHPTEGVIKIARHSDGVVLHPQNDARVVTQADEAALRAFLADTFPALANAPIVYTRRCLYCDTLDEHFWISQHPQLQGLTVAAGGSGHGFKFAPVLGDLIADAALGIENEWLPLFRWRDLSANTAGLEAARHHEGK